MTDFNSTEKTRNRRKGRVLTLILSSAILLISGNIRADESASPEVFGTPEAAVAALVSAARSDNTEALMAILGGGAREVLSSGDPVADDNTRSQFVANYDEMHRLAYDDQGRVVVYVGADNWPMPIPLVKSKGEWEFDTDAGKKELLFRRIGQNELYTIGVLEVLVDAQREYSNAMQKNSGIRQFAQKILSSPGRHDGLYWPVAEGEIESPIGPLVADAASQGYKKGGGELVPFHGYFYKLLTRQGPLAPGGMRNYLTDGKMTGGFAFFTPIPPNTARPA